MKVSDPQFGNLFARLSKYTPSEGEKRKLEPIENFCTEALAFFLIQSSDFRNRFVTDLLGLKDVAALTIDIETQCSEGYSGYADLVLSIRNSDRRIGIEVKLDADFQKDQLARMVKAFGEDAFLLAPELFVRSHREKINPSKIRVIHWESVHRLLIETAKETSEPVSLARQFADFLNTKGCGYLFMKTYPLKVNTLAVAVKLVNEWHDFLQKARGHFGLESTKRSQAQPLWDPSDGFAYFGVYGSGTAGEAWMGFEIQPDGSTFCYLTDTFKNRKPSKPADASLGVYPDKGIIYVEKKAPYPTASSDLATELIRIFEDLKKQICETASKW